LPPDEAGKLDSTTKVLPLGARPGQASTDAGDVSWNVPTIGFRAATFVPGVVAHTWQAAATSGMSIGQKGMVVAAKALAITGADLFADAKLIADAKAEFRRQLNGNAYQSVIPESQKPPLGYRNQ
jgi:aminobenzoyl-glutamate utilization protein B